MIHECREREMRRLLNVFIREENESQFKKELATEKLKLQEFLITENDLQTIKVQLRALGLITMSQKRQRSVKDTDTYWTLTPYGNEVMNSLRAIRRPTRTG